MSEADPVAPVSVLRDPRGVLPAGTRLRSYELLSVLGQGGFGITYRARDQTLGRSVAVKEYLPSLLAVRDGPSTVVPRSTEVSEQFLWGRERFLEEARTLALFDRVPGIVRVYDFLEANGTAYMVMELAEGETLLQKVRREKVLSPPAIERLLDPLLDGLQQVHAARFLHRDIKPANIMLDAKGNPTLIDFGASRVALAEHSMAMTAVFTPGYAAAEQFTTAKQGPYTDIYGLSATLYHAITGQIPPSAFDRMLDDAYKPLSLLRPLGYPPGLIAGIDAGMALRAVDRPQSIADWRAILGRAAPTEEDTRIAIKPRPASPARVDAGDRRAPDGRRLPVRSLVLGIVSAAAVGLVGAGYFIFTSDRPLSGTAGHTVSAEGRKAMQLRPKRNGRKSKPRRPTQSGPRSSSARRPKTNK
jgi:serine/threonine protein kinase